MSLFSACAIWLIKLYQITVSPCLGPCCRYSPTCSEYMIAAIDQSGLIKGLWHGLKRLATCHPWHNPAAHEDRS